MLRCPIFHARFKGTREFYTLNANVVHIQCAPITDTMFALVRDMMLSHAGSARAAMVRMLRRLPRASSLLRDA